MPRKAKDEKIEYPDLSHVQLTVPSGWCMTGHHNDCNHIFWSGICGCNCHKGEE